MELHKLNIIVKDLFSSGDSLKKNEFNKIIF